MLHHLVDKWFSNCGCSRAYLPQRAAMKAPIPGALSSSVSLPLSPWHMECHSPPLESSTALVTCCRMQQKWQHVTSKAPSEALQLWPRSQGCSPLGPTFSGCPLWGRSHSAVRSPPHAEWLHVDAPVDSPSWTKSSSHPSTGFRPWVQKPPDYTLPRTCVSFRHVAQTLQNRDEPSSPALCSA